MDRHLEMHQGNQPPGGATDPVCGMAVDRETARERGLVVQHEGTDYFFCGKGCKLDFQENPGTYLAPGYEPHME
jgi:Cu+-exporting ATPase